MSTMIVFVVAISVISVAVSQNCSSYKTIDSALKGATHENNDTTNGSCDNELNNATWYRFTGQFQQIKMTDTCVDQYYCNAKDTYALNASSKSDVLHKKYNVSILVGKTSGCGSYPLIAFVNVYECDTFLLYNIPVFGGPYLPKQDCMYLNKRTNETDYEPAGFCLEDTVKPLILSTELLRHTFKIDKTTGPLKLNANATRSPTPPLISWSGGGKDITIEREGFNETIFNMWSEISIPSDAEYRKVQYCVDTTCRTFNLYSVEIEGVVQKDKVAYITATVKSNIVAMDISWQVGIHTYNSSENDVVVNDEILEDGIQVASLTLYKNLDGLNDATISLTINDSSTATTVIMKSIALCSSNTYFSKGSCKECPATTVSPEGSINSGDCKKNEVLPLSMIIITIGVICLLLIALTIGVIVYKRRTRADQPALKYNVKNDG